MRLRVFHLIIEFLPYRIPYCVTYKVSIQEYASAQTVHLNSVFPMMIALFDPNYLPIDLCQDSLHALLWLYKSVVVQFWIYKVAQVVRLELDAPNATEMPISSILVRKDITHTVSQFVWPS